MIKEAIEKILELSTLPTYLDKDGNERFTNSGKLVGRAYSAADSIKCSSLDSVVAVAKATVHRGIEIQSPSQVTLYQYEVYDGQTKKETIADCKAILPTSFMFGQYYNIEEFIIKSCDFFERDEAFNSLIATVSAITEINSADIEDDGISQRVTVKSGIGRKDNKTVNPFVTLRAYRTFREIEQPQAQYLLRISKNSDKIPMVSLHEASGYLWKIQAIDAIAEYFKSHLEGVPVYK